MSLHEFFNISNETGVNDDYSYGNDYQQEIPPYIGYLVNGFSCIIIALNVPSVLVLFLTRVEQSNFVSMHILCLSLTDCGVGLSLFLLVSLPTFNYWDCLVRGLFFTTMYIGSTIQVAVICLDRVLMFQNLAWKSVTKNSALIFKLVLASYAISMLLTVIPMVLFVTRQGISMCVIEVVFVGNIQAVRSYVGILFICMECFIILCIATIIRFLWKRKYSKRVNSLTSNQVQNRINKETQAIITLCIIVGVYIILTTPLNVFILISGIIGESADRTISASFVALACLNSACNPIVYSFRIPEIKAAFKTTWDKIRCR